MAGQRIGDQLHISARTLRVLFVSVCSSSALVLYFITMLFLRGSVERVSDTHLAGSPQVFRRRRADLRFSGSFALLIVMIPLIITIVGIPLAVILGMSWFGVVTIAGTVFVYGRPRHCGSHRHATPACSRASPSGLPWS